MLQNKRLLVASFASLQISRYICSSSAYSSLNRETRFITKMINGSRKSKKTKWYDNTNADLRNITPVSKTLSVHTVRRMVIRDKIFMEHITDQISMGGLSDVVTENIEITHVKITPDFKCINVHWTHNTTSSASISKEELQKCARIIRQRLSELRVIGVIPPIQFVENKQCLITKEVDKRLAIIEKDLESWFPSSEKELDALYKNISDQLSYDKTEQTNDDSREILKKEDSKMKESCIELPAMRHDVLALDHNKIMSRITSSLSKANKASQRRLDMKTTSVYVNNSCDPKSKVANFLTQEEQQKIFSEFLIKRRREEKHRFRQMKHQQKLLNDSWKDVEVIEETEEYEDDVNVHDKFNEEE